MDKSNEELLITEQYSAWVSEKELLRSLRTGIISIDYKLLISKMLDKKFDLGRAQCLRAAKDSTICFLSACASVAVDCGILVQHSIFLENHYLEQIEKSTNYSSLTEVACLFYQEFITSVYMVNASPNISKTIHQCISYIEQNLNETLSLTQIASSVGYTESHLAKKFKAEVGCTIHTYIQHAKIEYSKHLLSTSQMSIQDISDELGFCSRGYFCSIFKKIVGVSPSKYRSNYYLNTIMAKKR